MSPCLGQPSFPIEFAGLEEESCVGLWGNRWNQNFAWNAAFCSLEQHFVCERTLAQG